MLLQPMLVLVISIVLLLIVLVSGRKLHLAGEPYPKFAFGLHKFITIGIIAFMATVLSKLHEQNPFEIGLVVALGIAVFLLVILLVSGGILGAGKQKVGMPFIHMLSSVAFTLMLIFILIKTFIV